MKRRLISLLLALIMVAASASMCYAANQYAGMYSGITGTKDAIYVTDTFNKIIWKYADGKVTRYAGKIAAKDLSGEPLGAYVDSTLDQARFMEPWAISAFADGWAVSDAAAHVVRYVDKNGVRTLAGSGKNETLNGSGKGAAFMRPTGLATDKDGNLYIADSDAGTIRKIDPKGKVTTFYSGLTEPTGLCWKDDVLYIAETGANRIVKITKNAMSVVAGGGEGYSDGPCAKAQFSNPLGLSVDDNGTIYVADTGNSAIRKIAGGRVSTLINSGDAGIDMVSPRSTYINENYLIITDYFTGQLIIKALEETTFKDVPAGIWYEQYVKAAADRRIVNGVGGSRFAPDDKFTRAELVTILSRLEQEKDRNLIISGAESFTDVAENAWYADAIGWAAENNIVNGIGGGLFGPDYDISRADICVMLYRYAVKKGYISADMSYAAASKFPDYKDVPAYAKAAVDWACSNKIMNGSDGMILPLNSATRAEAIKLIMAFADKYNL